eukprot:8526471-Alexandrium_andersonii.AAC.1
MNKLTLRWSELSLVGCDPCHCRALQANPSQRMLKICRLCQLRMLLHTRGQAITHLGAVHESTSQYLKHRPR